MSDLSPHLTGSLNDEAKLLLLVFNGDSVAQDGAGETTLGAHGQSLERNKTCGFTDARGELLRSFQPRRFGGHQAQDYRLVLRDFPQRFKRSRAAVVVFEEQPLRADPLKQRSGDQIVSSRGQPTAVLITASEMKSGSDTCRVSDDGIVHFDSLVQPVLQTPSP